MLTSDSLLAAAVNLSKPGTYLHWSIFDVSVANLVLIAVMVVIFGLALVLPFPGRRNSEGGDGRDAAPAAPSARCTRDAPAYPARPPVTSPAPSRSRQCPVRQALPQGPGPKPRRRSCTAGPPAPRHT